MTSRILIAALALGAVSSQAAVSIAPLSGFSPNGDGWLAPGEGGYSFLGTASNERGLAYGNGHLYLVSHGAGNFVRILNPLTGSDMGALNTAGISGGTFVVNSVAVAGDGAIYVNNLTTQATTSPLKVYKWATEGSVPSVAYSGNGGLPGGRIGDNLAAIGSGSATLLALGYGSTPNVAGNNGYAIVNPTAGTATAVHFAGTPPLAGDFRLSTTFTDASHVLGSQGNSLYRDTSFSGGTGTLLASPLFPDPAGATADRLLDYTEIGGEAILAVQSTGDAHVSLYDVTDLANPIWLGSANNTTGSLTANGNGTGQLAWGPVTVNGDGSISETLYAMSANQGIQAFVVTVPAATVPEPSTLAFSGVIVGGILLAGARRLRK